MFVRFLAGDKSAEGGAHPSGSERYNDPTWEQVRAFVEALDGRGRTYVMLSPTTEEDEDVDDRMLVIRADGKGMYFCDVMDGDEYHLVNRRVAPPGETPPEGELSPNSTREYIDLDSVLAAARTYFETGERDPALAWEMV